MKWPRIAMRYRCSYLGKGAAVFYRPVKAKSGMKRPEIAMRYRGSYLGKGAAVFYRPVKAKS
ncbi:MAG: hypothetical protein IIY82_01500, partial [Firmicutes bacterium]|nr:hypothetical protein [Bacillota bacterium]